MNQEMLELTKKLVEIPSVNNTPGEAEIGRFIESYLRSLPYFQAHPERVVVQELSKDPLKRRNVLALLLGEKEPKAETLLFHGHTDTVGTEDYGVLEDVAFLPDSLRERLSKLELSQEVRRDLESGEYLFGRGALDMKSGIAVFLVLLKEYARRVKELSGNLLVSFNPVEENAHTGIIEGLSILKELKARYGLHYKLAVNNDYICPLYQEDPHRYIYTGVVGKVLPCFYIQGRETHVGQCFEGFDATMAAAGLVEAINYRTEFCDGYEGEYSLPPTVLKMKDLKPWYNVQTADSAFVYFNLFVHHTSMTDITKRLKAVCYEVMEGVGEKMSRRGRAYLNLTGQWAKEPDYSFLAFTYEELLAVAQEKNSKIGECLAAYTGELLAGGEDKREIPMKLIRLLLREAGIMKPAIVLFYAAPYCPHNTLAEKDQSLTDTLEAITEKVGRASQTDYRILRFFPSLSDSSYLRIDDSEESLKCLFGNFPQQEQLYPLPVEAIRELDIPAVNFGCYGKDAHKWTERVNLSYSFGVLPELIKETVRSFLGS